MQFPPKKKLHGDCHFLYYFSKYPNTPSASKHGQAFGILPGISLCPLIRTPGKIFTIRISNKINCSVCSGVRVSAYNPQIQISAESETKRSIFREKDKTKRSKKESAQHSKSRNKSFVMTSVSAL